MKFFSTYVKTAVLTVLLVVSCKTPEREMTPSVLKLTPETTTLSPFTESLSLSLQCDLRWSAALEDESWGEIVIQSSREGVGGTILFKCGVNRDKAPRANTLVIKAGKSELRQEIVQEGFPMEDTPGFYGMGGKDYLLGTGGWNQASFLTKADGSARWRLLHAGELSAITLTGIRADAATGQSLALHVNFNRRGVPGQIEDYQATLKYVEDGTWWYSVNEGTYFVVKKEVTP